MEHTVKPLLWISSSKKDLMEMPEDVITDFGYSLYQAQIGKHPDTAKTLSGFGGASVVELVQDHKGDTFRAVYSQVLRCYSGVTCHSKEEQKRPTNS